MSHRVIEGDCVEVMRSMDAASVHAVVCDPPYSLAFMGREWDDHGGPLGFEAWCEAWAREALRVLKPGGHLLAFGGTRTYHRLATGIEDAGFEVRDTLAWMYGSGFPKSLNLAGDWDGWGTALKPAFEPVVVARKPLVGTVAANVVAHGTGALNIDACRIGFTTAADEAESKAKNRHGDYGTPQGGNAVYGDFSMLEPRTNYDAPGRWPANVLLDEDAASTLDQQTGDLPAGIAVNRTRASQTGADVGYGDAGGASRFYATFTRHHGEDSWSSEPAPTAAPTSHQRSEPDGSAPADAATSASPADSSPSATASSAHGPVSGSAHDLPTPTLSPALDAELPGTSAITSSTSEPNRSSGSASTATPPSTDGAAAASADDLLRFRYSPKASRAERNAGLDGFADHDRSGQSAWAGECNACGCRMMLHGKPTCGHDDFRWTTGKPTKNAHPTVKPVDVMRWLVRLTTPPGGVVLDPFTGSGTTGIASILEGFHFVGIERDPEYAAIARARLAHFAEHGEDALEVVRAAERADAQREAVKLAGQTSIFDFIDDTQGEGA